RRRTLDGRSAQAGAQLDQRRVDADAIRRGSGNHARLRSGMARGVSPAPRPAGAGLRRRRFPMRATTGRVLSLPRRPRPPRRRLMESDGDDARKNFDCLGARPRLRTSWRRTPPHVVLDLARADRKSNRWPEETLKTA